MLGYARILNTTRGDLYENPLQVGELVKLKSGGPVMTVEGFTDSGNPMVLWTDRNGVMSRDSLPAEMLQRARRRSFFGYRR